MPEGGPIAVGKPLGLLTAPGLTGFYHDGEPEARTISSRRVERAVETDDFLRLCAEEKLTALQGDGVWVVGVWYDGMPTYAEGFYLHKSNGGGAIGYGRTIREAYHRYHAAVDK
jgi:hypothetical protein